MFLNVQSTYKGPHFPYKSNNELRTKTEVYCMAQIWILFQCCFWINAFSKMGCKHTLLKWPDSQFIHETIMGTEPQKRPDLIPLAYECLHRLHICPLFVTMPNQNQQEPYHQALLPGTPRGFDQTCLHRRREEEVERRTRITFASW